jgi:hypothetical protein
LLPGSGRPFELAKLAGAFGHHVRKSALAAGDALRQHHAGIIAALDDGAVQQIVDGNLAVKHREHGRIAGRRAALAPGIFADGIFVGRLDVALLEGVKHHLRGHQLHHAGRRPQLVGVFLEQDAAAGGFDQDRGRRIAIKTALLLLGALDAVAGGIRDGAPTHRDRDQRRNQAAPGARERGCGRAKG